MRAKKIVLTGGPCAGKTTSLRTLNKVLPEHGIRVYVVPEAATLFFSHGCTVNDLSDPHHQLTFQTNLLKTQLFLEDMFVGLANESNQPAVVVCDRGAMDGRAYMSSQMWQQMLSENNYSEDEFLNRRYDSVLFLVTAAEGASDHYNTDTNHIRSETPDQAIDLDHRTRQCWAQHPRFHLLDNTTDFTTKIQRVIDTVLMEIGEQEKQ
eukprot:c6679_g1_i1.p1 GENE.c6679_g1_i1~~c6679_g1_i1.p1  ORF type:complete len:215 (-),score=44.62 c6679_g1_i1:182-805(-)